MTLRIEQVLGALGQMAHAYVRDGEYINVKGEGFVGEGKAHAFAEDVAALLDSADWRKAFDELAGKIQELEEAAEWRMDIRRQVEQADTIAKTHKQEADKLRKQLDDVLRDLSSLRMAVDSSERENAMLRGYLRRVEDETPRQMVPSNRPRHIETILAASGGSFDVDLDRRYR